MRVSERTACGINGRLTEFAQTALGSDFRKSTPYILYIMEQWENKTEKHYNAERTAHIYGAWMNVLNTFIHGMPLSGQHIHQASNYEVLILKRSIFGTRKKDEEEE